MGLSAKSETQVQRYRLASLKSLVLLLLAELQQVHRAESAGQSESASQDASWVLSVESVSRMVPLLQQAEAATRLQEIVTGKSASEESPKTILLRHSPVPVHLQLLLLHSARAAFAVEERLLHGIVESHFRTLLFLVHAALSLEGDARDVLRLALDHGGLVAGVVDIGDSYLNGTPADLLSAGQKKIASSFLEAVTSAENFVRDLQHVVTAVGGLA